jgi:tetratricopeptide (TPR) repeat protein
MNLVAGPSVEPGRVLNEAIAALNKPGSDLPLANVERALKIAPTDARLWHAKGLIHRERDQRELAIPALRRAVELAPEEPLIAHGFAHTLLEAGLPSVDAFARAMKLAPNNPEVTTGMVAALVAEGRAADAIAGLETALQRSPLWVEGHKLLASLRWAHGERTGFTRSIDGALATRPDSLDLRRQQLVLLIEAEQFEDALAQISDGRSRYGEHVLFTANEAVIRSETGDAAEADELFARIPPLTLANFDVRRVRHYLRTGRPQEASDLLDGWLRGSEQDMFWPYAATAWRLTGDPRSEWLEGDPRLIGVYDIADRLPALDELASLLRRLHIAKSQPHGQSVRGGTQTEGHLFHRVDPPIIELREAIRQVVAEHADSLPPLDPGHPLLRSRPGQIRFSGAWSVRLQGGGLHSNHVHPFGWLSSALYIALPPEVADEHSGWLTLGEPQAQLGLDLAPIAMVEPKVGRLALFPSYMWHGTRPFASGERLTVAFDVARPA